MVRCIAVCILSTLHIDFYDTKATNQIGIYTIYADAADSFVSSHHFVIQVADISYITF